jgi:hypothetical protein
VGQGKGVLSVLEGFVLGDGDMAATWRTVGGGALRFFLF